MNIYCCILLGIFLIYESVSDIKYKSVSLKSIMLFFILEILVYLIFNKGQIDYSKLLFGALPGVGVLFIGALTKVMGIGDGAVLILVGLFVGINFVIKIILLSFFIMGVFGIIVIAMKKVNKKSAFPYIPFLLISYMGVVLLG